MLRLQIVLVGVLIGALLLAGFGNRQLREQLNRASRSIAVANKTKIELQTCSKQLGEQRLVVVRVESEKKTLDWKIQQMQKDMNTMKAKADKIPEKEKEIERLKTEQKKVTDREKELTKQLQEAQKALDVLSKEDEARRAKAAEQGKAGTTTQAKAKEPSQKPPK